MAIPLSPLVYAPRPDRPPSPEEVGGKAFNLWRMGSLGLEVPRWAAVTSTAFDLLVLGARPWPRSPEEAAHRRDEVLRMDLPENVRAMLAEALLAAGLEGVPLAVRSSAATEDGAQQSFAGQFDTVLGVTGADGVAYALRRVWASAFHAHAAAYASSAPVRMAVILQELVDSEAAGVAFSADPVSGRTDRVVVSAVHGLGEGLVSGDLDADTWRVGPGSLVERTLARKERQVRRAAEGGTRMEPVPPELQERPCLTDAELREVAEATRRLAAELGGPQDIEFALAPGSPRRLVLLQSRPITTLGREPAGRLPRLSPTDLPPQVTEAMAPSSALPALPGGEHRVWDNSNIVESYSGVTTALTFTFARTAYEEAYPQLCRALGVPEALIARHRPVFVAMLGYHQGRVYYNLLNWYRTLALLPGFSFNRSFMERMMGVGRKLEDPPEPPYRENRAVDLARLAGMVGRLTWENARLESRVAAFHARVDGTLAPLAGMDLRQRGPDDLAALYSRMEEDLLRHWETPLVNDFLTMIFHGLLGRLVEQWLPGAPPTLANDLLCGEGGMISAEPARRMTGLARLVQASPELTRWFSDEPDDAALWPRLQRHAELGPALQDYLARFGERCADELKLETRTLSDEPARLVATLRSLLGRELPPWGERETAVRAQAEAQVEAALSGVRLSLFRTVLGRARSCVRHRENMRFERTRVFAAVRRVFLALGHHLATARRLDDARDVFDLTRDELLGWVLGTGVTRDLRALAALRRREREAWAAAPPPPDRFETWGPPEAVPTAPAFASTGATLQGLGCCPGRVRAPVRIVRDPSEAGSLAGRILVAERTDPGWTLLFPAAEGLLVQRGSLLSHSAIVAREMGLPCVVGLPGLLQTLRDGEVVEMDGATGVVHRLEAIP